MNIHSNLEWLNLISQRRFVDLRRFISMGGQPIVICGCGRSGTSLLLSIISAHSKVYGFPLETNILCHQNTISPFFSRLNNKRKLAAYIKNIKPSANRWCEKTPRNVRFIDDILEAYDDKVKILNVIRDGRDVVCSIHPSRKGYWLDHKRWVNDVKAAQKFEGHPSFMSIKYEDLINDTRRTLKKIIQFLEIPFESEMMKYYVHTNVKKLDSFHGGHVKGIYKSAVGKWKDPSNAEQIERALNDPDFVELLSFYQYK